MDDTTVTVSSKYQVVIPKSIRERYNIKPGSKIDFLAYGDRLSIVPTRPIEELEGFLAGRGLDAQAIIDDIHRERDEGDRF